MRLNVELRRWRTEGRKERRVPRVRWEGLMNEEKKAEYEEKTRQKYGRVEGNRNGVGARWRRCW